MHVVYLALGSNLGDRAANLRRAVECLPPWVIPSAASPVYETPPWGYTDQPAFLNQVIRAETLYEPVPLLEYLKHLEVQLGRTTTFRNGPRVIDLDILLYDEIIYDSPSLTLPHPRLSERAFVLVPLVDLAPDLLHPIEGISMRQLLSKIDASEIKTYPV
jgi:2-amino-4-hydroxy-6-hydroxymethyldihydropteridine diphosphokinase